MARVAGGYCPSQACWGWRKRGGPGSWTMPAARWPSSAVEASRGFCWASLLYFLFTIPSSKDQVLIVLEQPGVMGKQHLRQPRAQHNGHLPTALLGEGTLISNASSPGGDLGLFWGWPSLREEEQSEGKRIVKQGVSRGHFFALRVMHFDKVWSREKVAQLQDCLARPVKRPTELARFRQRALASGFEYGSEACKKRLRFSIHCMHLVKK